jgi:hypothetical protein
MKLLGRWRAWWNRRDWPDRGAFVISTEMDPQFDPPYAGYGISLRADWRPAVTVDEMPTEPATPPWPGTS